MKRFRKMVVLSLAIAGLLLASTAAKADPVITLTLDAPYQIGAGPVFDFYGTITNADLNLDDPTVYLNGDGFPVLDSGLTADDDGFYVNAPLNLDSGQSSGDILLFTMTAPAYSFYTGTYAIYGGYGDSDSNLLAAENFNIEVTPEPSSLSLLGVGLFAGLVWLGGALRRRQVSRVAV